MDATIAAISTAMSASGIGIVRISGAEAMDVIAKIYRSKNGKKNICEVDSHTIHYGFIYDGEEVVDEVLVMIMRGPRTYTGEDTVEIDCHGGVYAMKRVLETVLKNGAVIAEPGEFTKRAFLNGRLDLSQAEAVMDVIQAKNSMALKSSVEQLKGSVQRAVKEIRARLLHQIAYIETALDDPEHFDLTGYPQKLQGIVEKEGEKHQRAVENCRRWKNDPGRNQDGHPWKTKCRKIFSVEFPGGRGPCHRYRNRRNNKRYPGGVYFSERNHASYDRYCGNS